MIYNNIKEAVFIDRPNRFISHCEIDGNIEVVHVKNTGRCKELLLPGTMAFAEEINNKNRKTNFDLISVYKGEKLVNIDSLAPNKVFYEWAKNGNFIGDITYIKPEYKIKNSRFDFYIEADNKKIFVEVKGATLEENGIVRFPDAPTERGVKHISELIELKEQGYEAYVFFVIQMENVKYFTPNFSAHKEFGDILKFAYKSGVNVCAYDCKVAPNSLEICSKVEVKL